MGAYFVVFRFFPDDSLCFPVPFAFPFRPGIVLLFAFKPGCITCWQFGGGLGEGCETVSVVPEKRDMKGADRMKEGGEEKKTTSPQERPKRILDASLPKMWSLHLYGLNVKPLFS